MPKREANRTAKHVVHAGQKALLMLLLLFGSSSCRFVATADDKTSSYSVEISSEVIDKGIESLEAARSNGDSFFDWRDTLDGELQTILRAQDWDEAKGSLLALRSTCLVRAAPIRSATLELANFAVHREGLENGGCFFLLPALLVLPFDLVQLPIQVTYRAVVHANVPNQDLDSALRMLAEARRLGFDELYVDRDMLSETPFLDTFGYAIDKAEKVGTTDE